MSVWNGHYQCTCYHPLFVFNQFGNSGTLCAAAKPVILQYRGKVSRIYFPADTAFAMPEIYEYLEAERIKYAIRLPPTKFFRIGSAICSSARSGGRRTKSNFLRTLATPEPIKDWSLSSLKEKPIKIGAKVSSHGRTIAFQMAEVAIPRQLFQEILRLIAELRVEATACAGMRGADGHAFKSTYCAQMPRKPDSSNPGTPLGERMARDEPPTGTRLTGGCGDCYQSASSSTVIRGIPDKTRQARPM